MLQTVLVDGYGKGNQLKINGEGELSVVVHQHPPKDEKISSIPFRSLFTTTAGSSDMLVDGSSTSQEFAVRAENEKDVYIKSIIVTIVDAGATLSEFGNLAALTNGVLFEWVTEDLGSTILNDGIKTNFEFMRMALGNPPIGGGTSAYLASNVVSTSEAFMPVIDFNSLFGLQYGLRLRAGTNDKIAFTIRDNVSTMDQFDAIAFGIKI